MKKIFFILLLIVLVVLSACSQVQQFEVQNNDSSDSSVTHTSGVTPPSTTSSSTTTQSSDSFSIEDLIISGNPSKCDNLSVYDMRTKCWAIENRNPADCSEMKKDNDLDQCVLEVAKYSFESKYKSSCDSITTVEDRVICKALYDLDYDVCFGMKKSFTAASKMNDCIRQVATKLQNPSDCKYFESKDTVLASVCSQNCQSRWIENAPENRASCESYVKKGFTPIF